MAISSLYSFLNSIVTRTSDGTGNNIFQPKWGATDHLFVRVTPNSYLDGKGQMELLPAARDISNAVMAQSSGVDIPNAAGLNEFHQFFGQFLTHDIAEAPIRVTNPDGTEIFPIAGLPFPFARTPYELVGGVRQQHNEETSFLDLSQVYGHSNEILNLLREDIVVNGRTVQSAKLLTSGDANNLLPTFIQVAADSGKTVAEVRTIINGTAPAAFDPNQFVAGDNRANQNGALLTHQVMWMREHNWQVDRLAEQFPTWSQNALFEAARAVTEAEWQHVVYKEYLPKLVGNSAIRAYSGYKFTVDPSVINEWTSVAFRFGHDQSSNSFSNLFEDGQTKNTFTLSQSFALANIAQAVRSSGEMDEWVRGQLSHYTQEIDGKVVDGNRNALFGIPGATVDLNVFDIQRARDHGVGNYNVLRKGLGLSTYTSFEQFASANQLDADTLNALKQVYGSDVNKLDSIVGGLLEKNFRDSQLGETFTRLTVMQFERLRDGDRFYYENRFLLNRDVKADIESTTLADIIARTSGIKYIYHDAFAAHQRIGGTAGDDPLNGTSKADLIFGRAGNDTASGGGGDDDLYGDEGNDDLSGGVGKDLFKGGLGSDALKFGADTVKDIAVFNTALGPDNIDTIQNFTAADEIHLSKTIFTALTKSGVLAGTAFHVSATGTAADGLDRIIYDSTTGNLFYDPDGSGAAPSVQFARLDPKFTPTAADFVVIG